jgi:uncharacterized protein (DUF488 family)
LSSDSKTKVAFTVGHSTRPIDEFIFLLTSHDVSRLVDVRTIPRSRTNPQFNKDVLPVSLSNANITYVHQPELGGLRKPKPNSLNRGWRNLSFRGYADHMQTPEFQSAIESLLAWIKHERVAIMCAEAVPWRCHRSLIADALMVRGVVVEELVSSRKRSIHKLTPFAKVIGTTIIYPEL